MSAGTLRGRIATVIGAGLIVAAGCSNPSSPSPNPPAVAGMWTGTARLPNPYSSTMNLQQSGTAVSGTLRVAGSMGDTLLTGTITTDSRTLGWQVNHGCEIWSGTLSIDDGSQSMNGPVRIDRTGCAPARNSESGTLELGKR
jgi:hypothetical protein